MTIFVQFILAFLPLLLISSASGRSLTLLSFIVPIFAWTVPLVAQIFLKSSILFTILLFSSNSCTVQLWRLSYLSLLFSRGLHSIGYIFPFFLCLSLLLFSQLFLRPPQATTFPSFFFLIFICSGFCHTLKWNTFPSYICFSWGWFWWSPPIQCYKLPSIVMQATRPNPLNLFFISTI